MDQFILLVYELALSLGLISIGPFLLLSPKARAGIGQKLGLIPASLQTQLKELDRPIWLHCVSVGEFNAAWPFVQAFHQHYPDTAIVISTTTATGQKLALSKAGTIATIVYFPFDLPFIVSTWLNAVRPQLVAILETELWPCFTDACFARDIPIIMLNGRISPNSQRFHQALKPLFGRLLKKYSLISVQSAQEARRYRLTGGDNLPISIDGNLKYDGLNTIDGEQIAALKRQLNIQDDDLVLVAGSTHDGEEAIILKVLTTFKAAAQSKRALKVIIAPRHPERFDKVAQLISAAGYCVKRHSQAENFSDDLDVYMLDTIGSLAKFYCLGSLAFVGGTVAKVGGHNLAEPYAYGVPVVCGAHLFKTKDAARILSENDALAIRQNAKQVEETLLALLDDPDARASMGASGRKWLNENQGAVKRAMRAVEPLIADNRPADSVSPKARETGNENGHKITAKIASKRATKLANISSKKV
jgi:3-deoxy-D-manno-octulosonic-acid transferase